MLTLFWCWIQTRTGEVIGWQFYPLLFNCWIILIFSNVKFDIKAKFILNFFHPLGNQNCIYLWCPLLMIALYHQTKTPINFLMQAGIETQISYTTIIDFSSWANWNPHFNIEFKLEPLTIYCESVVKVQTFRDIAHSFLVLNPNKNRRGDWLTILPIII